MLGNWNFKRRDLRLFIFFVLVFTLFLSWGGDNSWSRYDLTAAMVEDGSFNIAPYSGNTVDKLVPKNEFVKEHNLSNDDLIDKNERHFFNNSVKVYNNSKVVVSGKAPFSSFLAVPGYVLGDFIAGDSGKDVWVKDGLSAQAVELSNKTSIRMVLISFSTSVMFGAASLLLVFYYLREKVDERIAFYSALILGLATPIFTYSTNFFGVVNALFFGFASYMALEKSISSGNDKWVYISGILSAVAYSFEYYAGIVVIGLLIYLVSSKRFRVSGKFILGALAGTVPLFLYHWVLTGNPILPPLFSWAYVNPGPLGGTCSLYVMCYQAFNGFVMDLSRIANAFIRLLIFPTRGIFFYSPILILSVFGIKRVYQQEPKKLIVFPGIFFLLLLFQATRLNWLAGVSFGPRYAIIALTFFSLPLAYGIERLVRRGNIAKLFVIILFLISTFNMFLGFGVWNSLDISQDTYEERFNSFSAVQPEFYDNLIQSFREYGPRSEIIMSLTDRYKGLDITYRSPYGPENIEFAGLVDNSIQFSIKLAPIIFVSLLVGGLLWPESKKLRRSALGIGILLFFISIGLANSSYISGEVYRDSSTPKAVNGSMEIKIFGSEDSAPYIRVSKLSSEESLNLTMKINNHHYKSYNLRQDRIITIPVVDEGKSTVSLRTDGCQVPGLENSSLVNYRCLSFGVEKIGENSSEGFKSPLLQGFFHSNLDSDPWMEKEADVTFTIEEDSIPVLEVGKNPYLQNSPLKIYVNGDLYDTRKWRESGSKKIYVTKDKLKKGFNQISLKSRKCSVPSHQDESQDDERCLSYQLKNFSVKTSSELSEILYTEGWRDTSSEKWMGSKGEIIANSGDRRRTLKANLIPHEKIKMYGLRVNVNNRSTYNFSMTNRNEIRIPLDDQESFDKIRFESQDECLENGERVVEDFCFNYRLENMSLLDNYSDAFFFKGWYDNDGEGRWMSNNSEMLVDLESKNSLVTLDLSPYSSIQGSKINLIVNGDSVKNVSLNERRQVIVPLEEKKGLNRFEIKTSEGCRVPAEVEDSSDTRCLSVYLRDLEVSDIDNETRFQRGWYNEEGSGDASYRWMREESYMIYEGSKNHILSFSGRPHNRLTNGSVRLFLNNREIKEIKSNSFENRGILLESQKGINTVKFESSKGCVVPDEIEDASDDERCLSFRFDDINIQEVDFSDENHIKLEGWFSKEESGENSYRWMSDSSNLVYNSTGMGILTISGESYQGLANNSSIRVIADGKQVGEIEAREFENENIFIEASPGASRLKLESSEGCAVPANVENDSTDTRCLSYRIDSIDISKNQYGSKWYTKEGDSEFSYRWMSEEATITFPAQESEETVVIEVKPYRYLSSPILDILSNGKRVDTVKFGDSGRKKIAFHVPTKKGLNKLTFRSRNGCEVPSENERLSNDIRCLSFQFNLIKIG